MTITTVTPITTATPKAARVQTREQALTAAVKAVGALAALDPFFLTMERDLLVTLISERKAMAQRNNLSKAAQMKAVA